jgi:hypothetical protein
MKLPSTNGLCKIRGKKTSGIGLQPANPSEARTWSFYIISGGGSADGLFFRDFELEFFQEFGVFSHFLA